jgi:hypothetical protein
MISGMLIASEENSGKPHHLYYTTGKAAPQAHSDGIEETEDQARTNLRMDHNRLATRPYLAEEGSFEQRISYLAHLENCIYFRRKAHLM